MGGRDHPGSRGNTCGGWGVHYLDCGAGDVRTYQTGTLNIHGLLHVNYTSIKLEKKKIQTEKIIIFADLVNGIGIILNSCLSLGQWVTKLDRFNFFY